MRTPRLLRAAVAAVAALVLAGCATIPSSGPVREGNPVERGEDLGFAFRPQGPEEGDTPSEILAGFIAAGAGPQDNYQVAREFLTRDLATEWNPAAGVLIHGRATSTLADSDASLRLLVPATASVDGSGRYTEFADAESMELQFRFAEEGGEWRISQAPDGTVLARAIFDRLFSERPLYFFDPTFTYLVPDLRFFPSTADAPTRIVEALLAGPAAPLTPPVLATAFPEGTRLERQSVTPTDGQATVELNDEVVQADDVTKQRMQFQLGRSLVGGSILSVRINVDGTDLDIPDLTGGTAPIVQPLINPSALVGRDGAFGFLTGGDLEPLEGLSDAVAGLAPSAAVYSAETELVAVLAGDGTVAAVRSGEDPVTVDTRPGLIAPALDEAGFVWTVPRGNPAALLATPPGGDPVPVASGWPAGSTVLSMAVSRDSTRLLTLLGTAAGPVLRVYGIVREDGVPVRLSEAWFDLIAPTGATTATWVSDTTVASLGTGIDGTPAVGLQDVGGPVLDTVAPVADAVALVGGNGQSGLRVLTSDGDVRVLRGTAWQTTASDVTYLATQQ
ncbi:LpqB family beta-propeller domain-containing protein [Naasia sp. SYSU D00057]|uniref:LpqB family beta-propeller domain-containing protein n=1 Tax=Naasia sp. SYSU D00057 TaxID=2817380 RepID=UPI001B30AF1D|nr:GerMN domain-containing protein [Naasia sp. SYSU D00057]